jgi:hypothetical protein
MVYKEPVFEEIVDSSHAFVYKHSPSCPICIAAKSEVDKFAQSNDVFLIIIPDDRPVSDRFVELKGGKPVRVLNHFDITDL